MLHAVNLEAAWPRLVLLQITMKQMGSEVLPWTVNTRYQGITIFKSYQGPTSSTFQALKGTSRNQAHEVPWEPSLTVSSCTICFMLHCFILYCLSVSSCTIYIYLFPIHIQYSGPPSLPFEVGCCLESEHGRLLLVWKNLTCSMSTMYPFQTTHLRNVTFPPSLTKKPRQQHTAWASVFHT